MTSSPGPAPEARRYLGLDLGGTNIKVAVVEERPADEGGPRVPEGRRPREGRPAAAWGPADPGGQAAREGRRPGEGGGLGVVVRETYPTEAERGPGGVVGRLAEVGREALERHGPVAATGVGLPGLFDERSGQALLIPNLPGDWRGVAVREPLAAALGGPVALINDARAFSLAEALLGAARGLGTVVCMVLGTGVGGGVVVDGRLLPGASAGEIGHQTVLLDGPPCGCGNSGCVEALVRADVFARRGGRATAAEVYAAARAGDERARAAVDHAVQWLSVALANAYVLLAPDAIVVGGGIAAAAGEPLLGRLEEAVRRRVFLVPPERVRVLPAALGPYAGAAGAALRAWEAVRPTLNTASMA